MVGKIAIENNLTPVKNYLTEKGYQVDIIAINKQSPKLNGYDAYVISGVNADFLGYEDTESKTVVINADGLSPEDIEKELDRIK
jgi:galactitol-specific phosphotransferase system IIB component